MICNFSLEPIRRDFFAQRCHIDHGRVGIKEKEPDRNFGHEVIVDYNNGKA